MKVYCPTLLSGKYFPTKYAHKEIQGGQNISPPVLWGDVPPETRSFVLSIIDIPYQYREVAEHASGDRERLPTAAQEMRNSSGDLGYAGPNPSRGSGQHLYEISIRALTIDSLPVGPFATTQECEDEIQGHVLATGFTTGIL
jgi:phosphatidylethanolamine-binding protein (PEBP) family uncharacterized protein